MENYKKNNVKLTNNFKIIFETEKGKKMKSN